MVDLYCRRVLFHSAGDENAFFLWLNNIAGILNVTGAGDTIRLEVAPRLREADLRELLGVFFRYDIEMSQLAQFASKANAAWFAAPTAYWHNRVFPFVVLLPPRGSTQFGQSTRKTKRSR